MSTVLTNGIIIPENGSRNWGGDLANNWNIIDLNVGYMTDIKNRVTTLENSVAENSANIQINTSNISALQTSKQDTIEDLETIRAGASAGATAVQPSALNNYLLLSGGAITGNIENRSTGDGWKPGFEWTYNNERFAYIHAFTDGAIGDKSLSIQADTNVNLASRMLSFIVSNDGSQNALNFQGKSDGTFNFYSNNPANLGTSTNKWKDVNTTSLNGKAPAYAYNATMTTIIMFVGAVLTGDGKRVSFIVPMNVDGSPTISFTRLRLRYNGNYLFGSTRNNEVTTSYKFKSTVINGGLNFVIDFSNTDTKATNNSCIVSEIILKLTY